VVRVGGNKEAQGPVNVSAKISITRTILRRAHDTQFNKV
jgi:hypothetical protein